MIKFVYFDVGGVVITDLVANNQWSKMKRDLGVTPRMDRSFEEFFTKYEVEVCNGRDIESLVPLMKVKFGLKFPKGYSFLEDFVNRFEKNEAIWPLIEAAKQKHRIGLLTNIYPKMLDLIKQRGLMPETSWNVIVDSSVEGCQKPDARIFKLAQEKAGVKPGEIMFVDNSQRHVKAAKKLGWQTFFYNSTDANKLNKELLTSLDLEISNSRLSLRSI